MIINEAIIKNSGISKEFINNILKNIELYKKREHTDYEIDDQLDKIEAFEDTLPYKDKINIAKEIVLQIFEPYKNVIDINDIELKLSLYKKNKESKFIGVSTNQNIEDIDNIEDHFLKRNIQKREIINALSTGFATKIQKDIALNLNIDKIPNEVIKNYLRLLKLEDIEMINISDDDRIDGTYAVSYSEISYNDSTESYIVTANADNIISLVFEAVLGIYEVIAVSYQENLDKETIEKVQSYTDTVNAEKDSFKYGFDMVMKFEEMYYELENVLIKKGIINSHYEENMITFLSYFYTLKEDIFLIVCENIFSDKPLNDYSIKVLSNIYKKIL